MYRYKNSDIGVRIKKNLLILGLMLIVLAATANSKAEPTATVSGAVGPAVSGDSNSIDNKAVVDVNNSETSFESRNENSIEAGSLVKEDISTDKTIQSITFNKDVKIRDALRFLAAKYQKNIVPSAKVDGFITVTSLYDVTFEEALGAILGKDFKYEQVGNFINVYTAVEYKSIREDKSRMIHKVFILYYITAAEVVNLASPILSSSGGVIKGSTALKNSTISTGKEGVTAEIGGDSFAQNDSVVVYDYPERIAKIEELIKMIDIKPKQILIEATILSADLTEENQLGIDLNLMGGVSLTGTAATSDLVSGSTVSRGSSATTTINQIATGGAGTPLETSGFAKAGANGLRIGIKSGDAAAFITALESITDITILANPKILALNKQVGTVFIGTKIGYRDRTTISDTGQATVGEVKFLDTGTKLSFRPYIANDGYIRMDIYPKDSTGELDKDGIPTETTAELITNIMVKDNQTIVIGGLFRDAVTTTRSQIPLLGDIPLVGSCFRGTTDKNRRQEIIVMLTPHIISEPEQTDVQARAADIARKRYGARMALQGISRARLTEDYYAKAVRYYTDGKNAEAMHEIENALAFRPTYLEAMRLKERIVGEILPNKGKNQIERIMLEVVEREEASKWRRY